MQPHYLIVNLKPFIMLLMDNFNNKTLDEFTRLTLSSSPAPGGGSVSALVGSLAASLSGMVASLSLNNKSCDAVREDMLELQKKADTIRLELLAAIQKDAGSFTGYMSALKLPKNTEEEIAVRNETLQNELKKATLIPIEIAEKIFEIFPLAETAISKGTAAARTDAILSVILARSAVLGSALNVRINLLSIKDHNFVAEYGKKTAQLEVDAVKYEKELLLSCDITSNIKL